MTHPRDRQVPGRVRAHVCITVNRSQRASDSDQPNWLLLFQWRRTSEKTKRGAVVTFPVFPEVETVSLSPSSLAQGKELWYKVKNLFYQPHPASGFHSLSKTVLIVLFLLRSLSAP